MVVAESDLISARQAAGRLVGAPIDSLDRVGGGRNSRVYRVCANGVSYALKQYPSKADDPRDRLGTEARTLQMMERRGFGAVPRFLGADRPQGFALLSWLDGVPVREVSESDIDQAADFLAAVHALRQVPEARQAALASEACLSGQEIQRQIEARLGRLRQLAGEGTLHAFLEGSFTAALAQWIERAKQRAVAAKFDFAAELPQEWRTLVPADFGFHNALRGRDGTLVFFDFEYFGWDDPVKLVADVMLHPGTPLRPALVHRFRRAAEALYGDDPQFAGRLKAFYPLFGLRWVLILLNEFLPERWQRRVEAGEAEGWGAAKQRQLARAGALLAQIGEGDRGSEPGL